MAEEFEYVSLTEEQRYRNADLGELWDRAEAGDPVAVLLRKRFRATEEALIEKLKPEVERMLSEGSGPSASDLLGLSTDR